MKCQEERAGGEVAYALEFHFDPGVKFHAQVSRVTWCHYYRRWYKPDAKEPATLRHCVDVTNSLIYDTEEEANAALLGILLGVRARAGFLADAAHAKLKGL